jgi:hypothetical protein
LNGANLTAFSITKTNEKTAFHNWKASEKKSKGKTWV